MARVTVIDRGFRKIERELHALERRRGQAGVWAGTTYADGEDVVNAAVWAEYGTSNAPSRPFLRHAADNGHDDLIRYTRAQIVALYVSGLSARGVIGNVAGFHSAQQQDAVRNSSWAIRNAPATIARKGFDRPLFETGALLGALTYRIV